MARTWGWHCGWEAAFPRRIKPSAGLPPPPPRHISFARPSIGQDLWELLGGSTNNPRTGTARTGQYYVYITPLGLGMALQFVGQWVTRTNDWVFWHAPFRISQWQIPGNLAANDAYLLARCTNVWSGAGAANYLALGFTVQVAPWINVSAHLMNGVTGALITPDVLKDAGAFNPPTGWIVATLAHEVATRNTYLYVNGVQVAGPYVPPAAVQNDMPMLPDNRYLGGKGADALSDVDIDDWGGAEGSAQADVPGANNGVLLAQPNADVLTQWTPHGFQTHYHNWDAENQNVECWGCHYNDPTGIGQQEACSFAPLALAAPPPQRVEAARFVWSAHAAAGGPNPSTHTPYGNIGGAAWQLLTGGVGYHSTQLGGAAPPTCFDSYAYWHGAQMDLTPEAVPAVWTMAAFNQLQGRLDATLAVNGGVEGFYAMAMVNAAARPMPTPNACPIAEIAAARQCGGEQPYLIKPEVIPYHHH